MPRGELLKLINGGFGLVDEPIDGLAGAVVAKAVLNVVELDGGVGGQADPAVPGSFGGADFTVAVFSAGGPDNVAALHLHYLAGGGGVVSEAHTR